MQLTEQDRNCIDQVAAWMRCLATDKEPAGQLRDQITVALAYAAAKCVEHGIPEGAAVDVLRSRFLLAEAYFARAR